MGARRRGAQARARPCSQHTGPWPLPWGHSAGHPWTASLRSCLSQPSRNAGPHLAPGTTLPCKHGHHRPLPPSLGARVFVGTAATEHSLPGAPHTIARRRRGCPGPLSAHRSTRKCGFRGHMATCSPHGEVWGQCTPNRGSVDKQHPTHGPSQQAHLRHTGDPGATPASSPGGQ